MAPLNGHRGRLRVVFQDRLLRSNLMEICSVPPIILSLRKNEDPSAMAPLVCCMPLASLIVAPVSYAPPACKAWTRKSHGGSAQCSGLSLRTRPWPLHHPPSCLRLCPNPQQQI